jgi:hypothetical protein
MSKTVRVVVDNVDKVKRALGGAGLMQAAMSGGRVVQSQARIYAPVDIGNLRASIQAEPVKETPTSAEVQIGSGAIYARIQELGGTIVPKTAKMLSWVNSSGQRVFAKAVTIKAQPYLRPAVDNHEGQIKGAISASINDQLARATK